jgi:hypothetical protein
MTIKRRWDTNVPIFGTVRRSKILKPGYTEIVHILSWDQEMKGQFRYPALLRVLSEDKVALEEVGQRTVPAYTIESFAKFFYSNNSQDLEEAPRWQRVREGNDINTKLLDPNSDIDMKQRRENRGRFDSEKIAISWEPTLPSQARK